MISTMESETTKIKRVAESYENQGYSVQIAPSSEQLPEFLRGYHPDLIVRGPKETMAVEVKTKTTTSVAERFREIAENVNAQPGWKFVLLYVPEGENAEESSTRVLMTRQEIEARISQAQKLFEGESVEQYDAVSQSLKMRNSITHGFKSNDNVNSNFLSLLSEEKSLMQAIK